MPDLLVTIGADASQYNKTMAQAGQTASATGQAITTGLNQGNTATTNLGNSAMSASMRFQTMRSGISAARDGVLAFSVGGQAADRSLLAMGHHITSLVNETGSFKGALSALAGSLWGAGGVILGISLAVELWEKFSKSQDEAKESVTTYAKSMTTAGEAASEEMAKLTMLQTAAENINLPMSQRLEAIRELKKEYPAYLSGISDETILVGKAQSAYEALSKAILGKAAISAAQEQLQIAMKPLVDDALKKAQQEVDNKSIGFDPTKLAGVFKPIGKDSRSAVDNATLSDSQRRQGLQNIVADWQKTIKQLQSDFGVFTTDGLSGVDAIRAKIKELQEDIVSHPENKASDLLQIEQLKKQLAELNPGKQVDAYQALEKSIKDAEEQVKVLATQGASVEILSKAIQNVKTLNAELDMVNARIVTARDLGNPNIEDITKNPDQSPDLGDGGLSDENAAFTKHAAIISEVMAKRNQLIQTGAAQEEQDKKQTKTIQELTRVIGSGLSDAFESALQGTQSFTQAMAQFLTQLIEKLIATATAALILSLIIGSIPGLGGGLGDISSFGQVFGQLSGLGTVVGGTGNKQGHAAGTIFMGPTRALVGEGNEPEALLPLSKLQKFVNNNQGTGMKNGQIVGVLSGDKLLLKWITRAQKVRNRLS